MEKLERLITSMGYEFVGSEFVSQGGRSILRIYIDRENGVTLDDCGNVSHQVSALLDVEDTIQGRYSLEVSSPGINRPLFELKHYQKYIGHRVKLRLHTNVDGRRQYQGILKAVSGDNIALLVEETGQEVVLPFSMIEKSNLIGDVRF
jgi:ribosome maturation factor RimP